jgi:hypothetical protein
VNPPGAPAGAPEIAAAAARLELLRYAVGTIETTGGHGGIFASRVGVRGDRPRSPQRASATTPLPPATRGAVMPRSRSR